jgi:hypothetical protein
VGDYTRLASPGVWDVPALSRQRSDSGGVAASMVKRVLTLCLHAYLDSHRLCHGRCRSTFICLHAYLDSHRLSHSRCGSTFMCFNAYPAPDSHRPQKADADRLLHASTPILCPTAIGYTESRCRSTLCAPDRLLRKSIHPLPAAGRETRRVEFNSDYLLCAGFAWSTSPSWLVSVKPGGTPSTLKFARSHGACVGKLWTPPSRRDDRVRLGPRVPGCQARPPGLLV